MNGAVISDAPHSGYTRMIPITPPHILHRIDNCYLANTATLLRTPYLDSVLRKQDY